MSVMFSGRFGHIHEVLHGVSEDRKEDLVLPYKHGVFAADRRVVSGVHALSASYFSGVILLFHYL